MNKPGPATATVVSEVEDSDVFPQLTLGQEQEEAPEPPPLKAPAVSGVVKVASALAERNQESPLDALELSRHLASTLGSADHDDVARYLVAWAARLGWRDPSAAARMLECLTWAKTSMRWDKRVMITTLVGAPLAPSSLALDEKQVFLSYFRITLVSTTGTLSFGCWFRLF